MNKPSRLLSSLAIAVSAMAASFVAEATSIVVINGDPANVGFNDPTPATPVGGNNGTTVGQQRLNVYQAVAAKWSSELDSSVPILVYATLTLPAYIGLEAALSFLGVGVIPPETTFGAMLANSVSYMNVVPTYLFIPGTVLIVLVVSFNLVGDALRDALDPKSIH